MNHRPKIRPLAAAISKLCLPSRKNTGATPATVAPAPVARTRRFPAIGALLPLGATLTGMVLAPEPARAQAAEVTLPAVNVRSSRPEEEKGYQPGITNTTKLPLLSRDIPASITVVPEQLIRDRGADTLREALRNVPGITFQAGEGGRIGDNIRLRGYAVVNDLYVDGIRDAAQYNRDVFNLDRLEVLRGSASMLFGRGSTGGVINQVSKQPFLYDDYRAYLTVGSHQYARAAVDLNKKTGEDAAFRLNAMKTDGDSFRDEVHTNRSGIAPSFRWGIGTRDEFSLSYYGLRYDDIPDYGVPMWAAGGRPVPVPVNRFYGMANVDYQKDSASIFTASWIHRFDADTNLRTVVRQGGYERDLRAVNPGVGNATVLTDNTTVTRGRQSRGGEDDALTLQSDFTTRLSAGGFKHLVLAGIEYQRENSYRWNYVATGNANPSTTLGYPDPYPLLPASFFQNWQTRTGEVRFDDTTAAVYAQDMMELTAQWKLLLGARYDDFRAAYRPATPPDFRRTDKVWSYRTGLIWQPDDFQSYYAAYGTSFNPSAESYAIANTAAENTPPEKNRNIEVGSKWELLEGNLSLRTALFRTEKTNERNTDASNPTTLLLTGRRHTDGVEIEAAGRLLPGWEIFAGVAFMRGRIDESINPAYVGIVTQNTPPYSANIWTVYRLAPSWRIGGGIEAMGDRTVYGFGNISQNSPPPALRVAPSYTRWDAMVSYEQRHWELRLNVLNVFNATWYDAPYENGGHVVPGTSRTATLTLTLKY